MEPGIEEKSAPASQCTDDDGAHSQERMLRVGQLDSLQSRLASRCVQPIGYLDPWVHPLAVRQLPTHRTIAQELGVAVVADVVGGVVADVVECVVVNEEVVLAQVVHVMQQ